jgi:flagellar biosynthetic protein FlhB
VAARDGKTEKPTPKRKREARRKGQIARTPDLFTWVAVLAATFVAPVLLSRMERLALGLFDAFVGATQDPTPQRAVDALRSGLLGMFLTVLPVLAAFAALAVVANLAQVGFLLTGKPLKPDPKRLSPIKGFKRLFSPESLWGTGKGVVKMTVLAALAFPIVRATVTTLLGGPLLELWPALPYVASAAVRLVRTAALAGLVIAVADYAYQRHRTAKNLMMSKEEVKEELKNQEGNPEIKGRIKGKMLALSRNRMLAAVPMADVVVVNPVHVAVALRYEPVRGAPRVVALGKGLLAERIRDAAEEHRVPIVESIPLAWALYDACDLDDEIPVELYEGVARVLAFVHHLGRRRPLGGPVLRMPDAVRL